MDVQEHSAADTAGVVIGKGAVGDSSLAGSTIHKDSAAIIVAFHTVIGKGTAVSFQHASATKAYACTMVRAGIGHIADGGILKHQIGIIACIDTSGRAVPGRAVQGHALQLYGGVIGFASLAVGNKQRAAFAGQFAAANGWVIVVLTLSIAQGKGQTGLVQVRYRDMAGEGVAVQVQGGAVLGVVDGHILGLVAQQVDGGGVSFCIRGIRCFHGLDGLVDAEILITAHTGDVTAGVLPLRGQGVDGLGRSSLIAYRFAGGRIVFQPDEVVGVLDAIGVQGFGIGQVDRTALGKQHIARDGTAVEQGLFAHGQGAVGSAQIQVAGQLAGGVIPDDAAHVRALGGREGDLALIGDINCTAVIGRIVIDFAAGHVQGRKANIRVHVHRATVVGGVIVELTIIDSKNNRPVASREGTAVRGGSIVIELTIIDGDIARVHQVDHAAVDSLIVVELAAVDGDGIGPTD